MIAKLNAAAVTALADGPTRQRLDELGQEIPPVDQQTPEGLRIQLVDQDGRPMFQPGTAEPMPYTKKLLAVVGRALAAPSEPTPRAAMHMW